MLCQYNLGTISIPKYIHQGDWLLFFRSADRNIIIYYNKIGTFLLILGVDYIRPSVISLHKQNLKNVWNRLVLFFYLYSIHLKYYA